MYRHSLESCSNFKTTSQKSHCELKVVDWNQKILCRYVTRQEMLVQKVVNYKNEVTL